MMMTVLCRMMESLSLIQTHRNPLMLRLLHHRSHLSRWNEILAIGTTIQGQHYFRNDCHICHKFLWRSKTRETPLFVQEEDSTPILGVKFERKLGDYISLVDPIGLLSSDFLPSIEALALPDREGGARRSRGLTLSTTRFHQLKTEEQEQVFPQMEIAIEQLILLFLGAPCPRRSTCKAYVTQTTLIDLYFDGSDGGCKVVYSIPESSV